MSFDIESISNRFVSAAGKLGKGFGARRKEKREREEKEAGAALIEKRMGPDEAEAYRLGIPPSVFSDWGKKKEDKDSLNYRLRENAKQTTLAEDYVTATSPMLEKATQELKNAMIKKDEKEIFKAKEKWSAFYNAYEGTTAKMKRVVSDTERTSVINVLNEFDKKIETMSPAALKTRYDISTEEAAKLSETISYIEKNKNLYNLGIDLSGMPTEKDLTKFALAAFKNNDLSYDDYMAVMNTTDDKKLLEIMNAKDETPTIKMLAAAVFKIRIVAQTVDSDILLQKGKKEELAKELQPKGGFFDFIKPQNYGQGLLNKKGL